MGTLPPPETRPNIYLRETPTRVIGLQTGTARAKLRFPLRCALLSVRPTTAAEDHAKGAEKANERKGGAPPYRRIPPETRPNIHLTKTPTAGKQDRININRAFGVNHRNASKHDRAGALTCTARMRVADYNLVLY